MSLSVCAITGNGGPRQEDWMIRAREYADELVIGVDETSPPETLNLARAYADQVHLFEHPRIAEEAFDWIRRKARCDWILALDDDEFMSQNFSAQLPALLTDRELTHYLIARRWVTRGSGPTGYFWIRNFPWFPDPHPRLFRNIGSIFYHLPEAHTGACLLGDGRQLSGDEACIYHMDLVWKDRLERETKVRERYGSLAADYYLYEERLAELDLVRVPDGELSPALAAPPPRQDDPQVKSSDATLERASRSEMIEGTLRRAGHLPVFSVEYLRHNTPHSVEAASGVLVEVEMRNTSAGVWRAAGLNVGKVMLSYHWEAQDGTEVIHDGRRSFLPRSLGPGESAIVHAGLVAPETPGRYRLTWDLVQEGVTWFADRGARPLTVEVEICAAT